MIQNAIPYFPCQIQSRAIFLQMLHHPNTLLIVTEWLGCILRECPFSNMTKRRMSKIMSQSNRLNQILIQKQRSGNRPSNLRNFQRMCQTKKPASYVSSDGMIWNAKSDPGLSEILYANRIFLPALLVLLSDPQSRHMYDRFDVLFFLILLELSIFFPFVHVKTHLYNIFHTFLIFPLFFYKKIRNSLSQTVPYLYL